MSEQRHLALAISPQGSLLIASNILVSPQGLIQGHFVTYKINRHPAPPKPDQVSIQCEVLGHSSPSLS